MKTTIIVLLLIFQTAFVSAQSAWSNLFSGTSAYEQLNSVYFTDANTGYAVSSGSNICKTTNGGTDWVIQFSGSPNMSPLYSVYFTDANTGYAVGYNGTIIKTTNAGTNWTQLSYDSNYLLFSVYFINTNTGFAVGSSGKILKTTNAGTNWTAQTGGSSDDLLSVYFTDANIGYAVGGSGTIRKTTNGGTTWAAQTSGTTKCLRSVYFTDANTGYVVGNTGTILKTSNAGTNWTEQTSGTTNTLFSVYFTDTNTGYAVGYTGTILKTINAGTNWSAQTNGSTKQLCSVYFTNTDTGYAVGNGGTILKTTTGGVSLFPANAGTISGLTSVCQGRDSVTYTVSPIINATSHIWSLPYGASGSSSTNSITVNYDSSAVSGNISVMGHNNYGDGSASILVITVNPHPTIPTIQQSSNMLVSSAATSNQWYFNGNLISGATGQVYIPAQTGNYYVVVTSYSTSCSAQSQTFSFTSGVNEITDNIGIEIYPNPVKNELIIETAFSGNKLKFELQNEIGQIIYTSMVDKKAVMYVSKIPGGIYFVKLFTEKEVYTKKFVKE
ncbi:MAG: T9SS type A sorting domain-containing protein [Bacteroidia bacterium]|nr:T9SS type A sorting domain-containing protein [Bacteroidia bacterium]